MHTFSTLTLHWALACCHVLFDPSQIGGNERPAKRERERNHACREFKWSEMTMGWLAHNLKTTPIRHVTTTHEKTHQTVIIKLLIKPTCHIHQRRVDMHETKDEPFDEPNPQINPSTNSATNPTTNEPCNLKHESFKDELCICETRLDIWKVVASFIAQSGRGKKQEQMMKHDIR